ncbi:helix-turn-helix domain-containing protein [Maribellus sediminis]|uniref:helix-turn-helix domain-containing protein n=1 Tax=Maribellus sediminis TaxID=2696285 RepID=UPI00197F2465|nr:helix-turn-helix domain-containing protein [Maribellus sediminis]
MKDSFTKIHTKCQNNDIWRAIDERFTKIENRLLFQKAVLSFDEASEYSGLSKSFLYKLTSTSKIPHSKPNGKQIFFDRVELENWLKRNPVKTQDEIENEATKYVTINNRGNE